MMARAARRSSTPLRGRSIVAIGLVSLLCVAAVVVWRRTRAVAEARIVGQLAAEKRELISVRKSLEHDIHDATSRANIVAAAERRLGMHVATELEVRNLPAPTSASHPSTP